MKRGFEANEKLNNSNAKLNITLEGIIISVTNITDTQGDKKTKYWSALICDANEEISKIIKYLSSKKNCILHSKMIEFLNNKTGIKLTKLKSNGENSYIITNETILAPKLISFTPSCTQIHSIQTIQSMSDGQHVSLICKIIHIDESEPIFFNNGLKKVQKLKKLVTIADQTDSININIWENHFNLIQENESYIIKLAKVKTFNDDVSLTTTINTTFERIDNIGDVNYSEDNENLQELKIIGTINSIGLIEKMCACPKCYSNDVECNDKTIRCLKCKSRSLNSINNVEETKIKLHIIDIYEKEFQLIVDIQKIRNLLEEYDHKELSQKDLIAEENILLVLSLVKVCIVFNSKNNQINTISINHMNN